MEIHFIRKSVTTDDAVLKIIKYFQDAFSNFKQQFPAGPSAQVSQPTVVNTHDTKALSALALRTVNGIPILGDVISKMTGGKTGETYQLEKETFELSPQAHQYYKAFIADLHKHFIRASSLEVCTKYDDSATDIPNNSAGILLLIQALLERVVARILCDQAETYGQKLIDSVLMVFIRNLNDADVELQEKFGLVKNGSRKIQNGFKKSDPERTESGLFLGNTGVGNNIHTEIESLRRFVSSFQELKSFVNAIKAGLSASESDGVSLQQRMIIGLVYLAQPNAVSFPTHELNKRSLSDVIQDYVVKAYTPNNPTYF